MAPPKRYDAIVIGAGQAGGPLAAALARSGRRHGAHRARARRRHLHQRGLHADQDDGRERARRLPRPAGRRTTASRPGRSRVDLARVRERKRAIVEELPRRQPAPDWRRHPGLELICGEARFTGPRTGGGRRPSLRSPTTSSSTPADAPPRPTSKGSTRVAYARLDLDHGARPGARAPAGAGRRLRRARVRPDVPPLRQPGDGRAARAASCCRWRTPTSPTRCSGFCARTASRCCSTPRRSAPAGQATAFGSRSARPRASGRSPARTCCSPPGGSPNTERLDLAVGRRRRPTAKGFITVNDRLETSAPGVYALGDVKGGPAFTHISYDDFRIIRTNLLQGGTARTTDRLVPYTVFIDPQLGRVGLGERDAQTTGP